MWCQLPVYVFGVLRVRSVRRATVSLRVQSHHHHNNNTTHTHTHMHIHIHHSGWLHAGSGWCSPPARRFDRSWCEAPPSACPPIRAHKDQYWAVHAPYHNIYTYIHPISTHIGVKLLPQNAHLSTYTRPRMPLSTDDEAVHAPYPTCILEPPYIYIR